MRAVNDIRRAVSQNPGTTLAALVVVLLIGGSTLTYPRQSAGASISQGTITLVALVTNTQSPPTATVQPGNTSTPTALPTETPTATASPTSTPTKTPTVTPTPRPAFLIWSPDGEGGFLRESPNGPIVILMPNGTYVEDLGDQEDAAGLTWQHILAFFPGAHASVQQSGWVADLLLYSFPDNTELVQVASDEGIYLRAVPQGNIVTWVGKGTPLVPTGKTENEWTQVTTLDAQSGWVLSRLLTPLELPR